MNVKATIIGDSPRNNSSNPQDIPTSKELRLYPLPKRNVSEKRRPTYRIRAFNTSAELVTPNVIVIYMNGG